MRVLLPVLLLLAGLAGCVDDAGSTGPDPSDPGTGPEPAPGTPAQVVVAVIDSAVNPYHSNYHRFEPIHEDILATLVDDQGRPPVRVNLSDNGTYAERVANDEELWSNIEAGRLYYFEGTRILGVSFGGNILNGGTHGIGTTSAVLEANPDAIVVLAQGAGNSAAEQWAATTPWVDILSESYGLYCGQPALELVPGDSTAKNNKLAWDNGKVPVGAADNTPCPAMNDGTSGPPWVVGISGDHPATEGACREPVSGNFPDFTADFTQDLPYVYDLEGNRTVSGTSFSTPTAAGSFSKALLMVREAWNHTGPMVEGALAVGPGGERLTQYGLWDAFNHTAYYFGTAAVCDEDGSVPVNPATPWVQMGWGHVDGDVGRHAGEVLLGADAPAKDPAAVAYMESVYAYRQQAWAAVTL